MKNERGVTLMELIIVVVIVGLMSAMAVPSFLNYTSKLQAKSTARDIVSTLRLARSKAVSERNPYGVHFDAGNRRYTFFKDKGDPTQYTAGTDSLISQVALDRDVNYAGNTFTNAAVIFGTSGGASTSGDLTIVPASGGFNYVVNVLASTGRVKLTD
jgi:type II secretion system protein H